MIEANAPATPAQIVTNEIREFQTSPIYTLLLDAEKYWRNRSDVQTKIVRIDDDYHSNTKIELPALRKLIRQKVNYLLAKPFSVSCEDKTYAAALDGVFDDFLRQKIKGVTTDAIKWGMGYLQPYFEDGVLRWARIPATEIIPLWEDAECEQLNGFIRFFPQVVYEGLAKRFITRAEFWTSEGVLYFVADPPNGSFVPDPEREPTTHFAIGDQGYNWDQVPLIWLKYNDDMLPLMYFIREILDDINWQKSITADVLRDVVNFIYVLRNYGGQTLAEFIENIKKHFAINVTGDGGVDKLAAELNIDAVMKHLEEQRRDLYDYANAVDTKDPNLGTASGSALNFRYTDLDGDCQDLGTNLKGALQRAKLFIDLYLQAASKGDFTGKAFDVIFATDLPVNETDTITNCKNSAGVVSQRTIVANHPWVKDPDKEIEQIQKEQAEALKRTGGGNYPGDGDDLDDQGGEDE